MFYVKSYLSNLRKLKKKRTEDLYQLTFLTQRENKSFEVGAEPRRKRFFWPISGTNSNISGTGSVSSQGLFRA